MFPTGSGTGALVAAQIKPFRGAIATFALVLVFWSASFASQRDALRQVTLRTANPTSAPSVCSPLLVSLSSATRTAANGAKCCPCQPCAQGEEFQQASSAWQAPSALAVCLRSHLGEVQLLGGHGGNFNTLIGLLDERSTVITIGTNKSDTTWEASLGDHVPGIHVSNQAADWLNAGSGQGSPTTLIDALKVDIGALEQGDGTSWASSLAGLAVCQLLVRIAGTEAAAWQQLQQAVQPHGFQLDSCKMGLLVESWRCTFFSLKHCNIKEGNAFEHA
ncbi:hypothetical protein CLOM_g13034 [Closterium sp. NIES-68]|nr:hypothetical protein CLOM_g13034 [Closterium sp. NIES-68]